MDWIEQPGSWQPAERKKNQHISWKQQFTSFIGSVEESILFSNSIYNLHIFQKATQKNVQHIQAALKDTFVTLKNMYYEI